MATLFRDRKVCSDLTCVSSVVFSRDSRARGERDARETAMQSKMFWLWARVTRRVLWQLG